jgi:beta-galactosidase
MSQTKSLDVSRRDILKGAASLAAFSALPEFSTGQVATLPLRSANSLIREGRDQLFDDDWNFHLGDVPGAEQQKFDDSSWRLLDLPHDWSIEDLSPRRIPNADEALWRPEGAPSRIGPFDRDLSPGQMATGYVVGGTGWYRKTFSVSHLPTDRRFEIRFDGVYMDSDIWVNGEHLGNHPYGYISFSYDITPHLHRDGANVIAVRVRNEGKTSRWYSGSGIYRHVWLTMTGSVRVPLWGVHIRTPEVTTARATIRVTTKVENLSQGTKTAAVQITLTAPDGRQVASTEVSAQISAGGSGEAEDVFALPTPVLWSHEDPKLYRAEIHVLIEGTPVDRTSVVFGIRKIEVDATNGLRINGKQVKLKGGCLHHDNGVLGAACINRAEERRVELMKANGYNAIRTSHNPPSPAFLDACDRLGVLVIDEAFDMWEDAKNPDDYHRFFDEWWERDLSSMVLRDRNHPSVIFWSVGNEIHERAEPKGVEIAGKLVKLVKELDESRPVTMAVCSFWDYPGRQWPEVQPAFTHLDVGGYNYEWKQYESDHEKYPTRVMMGTESFPMEAFENWQAVLRHSYVIGDFVWTGMDYLGEAGIGHSVLEGDPDSFNGAYPWFNAFCGDVDLIGCKKPQSYFRDVVWGISPIEMAVQRPLPPGRKEKISKWGWSDELRSWTWPGLESRMLNVRVYSTADHVRLLLNEKEIATKSISADTKLRVEFSVPYEPGELRAVALQNGQEIGSRSLRTVGKPAKLSLSPDRRRIRADRNDLAYVTVEVQDAAGNLVPDATALVRFSVQGVGSLAAVGSANPRDMASFRRSSRKTFQGKCLAVFRPNGPKGSISIYAMAEGLADGTVKIECS